MQFGIDSFAAAYTESSLSESTADRLRELVEQIEYADQLGLDVFGIARALTLSWVRTVPCSSANRTRSWKKSCATTMPSAASRESPFR